MVPWGPKPIQINIYMYICFIILDISYNILEKSCLLRFGITILVEIENITEQRERQIGMYAGLCSMSNRDMYVRKKHGLLRR